MPSFLGLLNLIADGVEVGVSHSLLACKTLLVINDENLGEEIESISSGEVLVRGVDELLPGLSREVADLSIELRVQSRKLILGHVLTDNLRADNLGNLDQLIVVVLTMEEGMCHENHTSEHAAERPDIKRVVIILHVDKKFRTLEVAGSDTDVILSVRMVELSKTPINDTNLTVLVINHNVVGLNITVHNTTRVSEVKAAEKLIHVEADVVRSESGVENLEVSTVDVLENKRAGLGDRVLHSIDKIDDVGTTLQVLKNLDLTTNLLFLNRLEDLDDNRLVVRNVDTSEDFGVLTATKLADNLVVILRVPLRNEVFVVPIFSRHFLIHISVDGRNAHIRGRLLHV